MAALPIVNKVASLLTGSVGDAFVKIATVFKIPPAQVEEHRFELDKLAAEQASKIVDQISAEITAGAEIIKAEAQSPSWLPRNVRPLLLLMWGSAITLNVVIAILAHFWFPDLTPVPLDPWVYKLTAGGFGGYMVLRSGEKLLEKD
jgi:hypothetical protein